MQPRDPTDVSETDRLPSDEIVAFISKSSIEQNGTNRRVA